MIKQGRIYSLFYILKRVISGCEECGNTIVNILIEETDSSKRIIETKYMEAV